MGRVSLSRIPGQGPVVRPSAALPCIAQGVPVRFAGLSVDAFAQSLLCPSRVAGPPEHAFAQITLDSFSAAELVGSGTFSLSRLWAALLAI